MYMPRTCNGEIWQGLVNRRESEWRLFMTGYSDKLDMLWPETNNATDMNGGLSFYDSTGNVTQENINKII